MSFVPSFNYSEPGKSMSQGVPQTPTSVEGKDWDSRSNNSEASDASLASDDSFADCPLKGREKYRKEYNDIIEGVFTELDADGHDWQVFVTEANSLLPTITNEWPVNEDMTNKSRVFMHVICNQYANHNKLKDGSDWEGLDALVDLYKKGFLPYFGNKKRKRKSTKNKYNFKKSKVVVDSEEEEEEEQEEGVYTTDTAKKHGLDKTPGFVKFFDNVAFAKAAPGTVQESKKYPGLHVFGSDMHLEQALPFAALEYLKKKKDMTQRVKVEPDSATPEENGYGLYGDDQQDEDRVRWIDDIFEWDLEDQINEHKNKEKILVKLEAQNASRAVREIAFKCGSTFATNFRRQPLEKDEQGRNIYQNKHKAAMETIYKRVKGRFIN